MIAAGSKYVAMGSSFAAGPGIAPVVDAGALRSGRNYAHQVAGLLGLELHDVTSSGALALELLSEPQQTPAGPRPPQLEAVRSDTALVTITAGGNDVRYIGSVTQGWFGAEARGSGRYEQWLAEQIEPLVPPQEMCLAAVPIAEERLRRLVGAVRRRAPRAVVVLVDYLTVLGPDTDAMPDLPLEAGELAALRRLGRALEEATSRAAAGTGSILIAASAASTAHGVGSAEPWVSGAVCGDPLLGEPIPFHPNEAGMTAVAQLLAERLGGTRQR